MKKSELPLVGTKGIVKVWVRGSSEADCEEKESVWGWGWFLLHVEGLRMTDLGVWVRVFERLRESVWETKTECLRDWVFELRDWVRESLNWESVFERVFESVRLIYCADFESYKLDFYVAKFRPPGKFIHVSVLTN